MKKKDELKSHEGDEQQDNELDLDDTELDEDDETSADTDEGSDDQKKDGAEEAKERQKKAWLAKIRGGQKTLDDMPENLNWLKKEVEKELDKPERKEPKPDELEDKIRKTLQQERDAEDLGLLVNHLENSDYDAETMARVEEEYKGFREDGVSKLRALKAAMRLAGIKDVSEVITERRRKGMLLPPSGSRTRKTVSKDGMNDVERKLSGGLPPGYKL